MAEECTKKSRCVFCQHEYPLEGAHVKDGSSFGSREDDRTGNILCLCRICHREFDGRFLSVHGSVALGLKKRGEIYLLGRLRSRVVEERALPDRLHIKSEYLDEKSGGYVSALQFWYWK